LASLQIPAPEVIDYFKLRMDKYQESVLRLRSLVQDSPDSVETNKTIDNAVQDILLLMMEDNVVLTQVRLDQWYASIAQQTYAFKDFLDSNRFLVLGMRKNYANSW
jgi:hypothetical protein